MFYSVNFVSYEVPNLRKVCGKNFTFVQASDLKPGDHVIVVGWDERENCDKEDFQFETENTWYKFMSGIFLLILDDRTETQALFVLGGSLTPVRILNTPTQTIARLRP